MVPVLNKCWGKVYYRPVGLLSVLEKVVNDRIVDHLEKCGLFL